MDTGLDLIWAQGLISIGPGARCHLGQGPDLNLALGLTSFGYGTHIGLRPVPILFLHSGSSVFVSVEMQTTIVIAENKNMTKKIEKTN